MRLGSAVQPVAPCPPERPLQRVDLLGRFSSVSAGFLPHLRRKSAAFAPQRLCFLVSMVL